MGVLSSRSASSTLSQLHCFVGMVSEVEIQKKGGDFLRFGCTYENSRRTSQQGCGNVGSHGRSFLKT
ncbi:unnamed protein product [Brassica rapa]|uniref:Uncharacterized protein n=1 Tax=Brassica campestris TaxID=3711 RepID=A0A8D9I149_BRACM|nr:unnamed protein product [Brassica rapa]